jgi:hypothetical protein
LSRRAEGSEGQPRQRTAAAALGRSRRPRQAAQYALNKRARRPGRTGDEPPPRLIL